MAGRTTKQKSLIESYVTSQTGFFNADELYAFVSEKDPSIGIATVYRNLKQLVSDGKLCAYTCQRRQVFSKTKQHCHFIDEKTGKVIHFEITSLDFLKNKIPGKMTSFQIEVRGTL